MGKIFLIILVIVLWDILEAFRLFGTGPAGKVLLRSLVVGAILGDIPTALAIGGSYELMNIGLNPLGDSAVPNYNLGAIVGTYYAITVSPETGTAMGIVVATLATMLNQWSYIPNVFVKGLAEKALKNHKWQACSNWLLFGFVPQEIITLILPVFVMLAMGESGAVALMNAVPEFITHGFQIAGNMLPGLGFAIVLRSLNVVKNIEYLLLGFALFAFIGVNTVGAAIIGLAVALIKYKEFKDKQALAANGGVVAGGLGDE